MTGPSPGASVDRNPEFLSGDLAAGARLRDLANQVATAVAGWAGGTGPRSAISSGALGGLVAALDPCPDDGIPFDQVLREVGDAVLAHGVRTFDPACAAHLHSPVLLTAAAAELAIGATNQSMDSYDQAPAATLAEDHLVRWLAGLVGLPAGASGVLTAGGTASNLLGLLLARAHARSATRAGWRIVASEAAHFSVQQAAAVLGLGREAVVGVATDDHGRIDVDALDDALATLDDEGLRPIALVGTAGTTDLGAVDPLDALADRATDRGAWFHVDAAVGAAFCLSDRLRPSVRGLERADSITADLHKLWWQPIGASALLVRDRGTLAAARQPSDYLDREEDDATGVLNLVSRSLDTSRRFDALKVLLSLRSTGRLRLAAHLEHLVATTAAVARLVDEHADLELLAPASTVTVVFRWNPGSAPPDATPRGDTWLHGTPHSAVAEEVSGGGTAAARALGAVNTGIQRALFDSGRAVIGRTRHRGRVALKLTLVNPQVTVADVDRVLGLIVAEGGRLGRRPSPAPTARPPLEAPS
ncbi:MAG: pyridoxal phosphate-dependent decarboxylase family protein [Acidimicrobiales bacterium]